MHMADMLVLCVQGVEKGQNPISTFPSAALEHTYCLPDVTPTSSASRQAIAWCALKVLRSSTGEARPFVPLFHPLIHMQGASRQVMGKQQIKAEQQGGAAGADEGGAGLGWLCNNRITLKNKMYFQT